jgi:hypothetical protein
VIVVRASEATSARVRKLGRFLGSVLITDYTLLNSTSSMRSGRIPFESPMCGCPTTCQLADARWRPSLTPSRAPLAPRDPPKRRPAKAARFRDESVNVSVDQRVRGRLRAECCASASLCNSDKSHTFDGPILRVRRLRRRGDRRRRFRVPLLRRRARTGRRKVHVRRS